MFLTMPGWRQKSGSEVRSNIDIQRVMLTQLSEAERAVLTIPIRRPLFRVYSRSTPLRRGANLIPVDLNLRNNLVKITAKAVTYCVMVAAIVAEAAAPCLPNGAITVLNGAGSFVSRAPLPTALTTASLPGYETAVFSIAPRYPMLPSTIHCVKGANDPTTSETV